MQKQTDAIRVPGDDEPEMTTETGDIHFSRRYDPRSGLAKVVIESEYAAKDAIKALDYDRTQRSWDSYLEAWAANLKDLNHMVRELRDTDHTVTVSLDVAKAFEEYDRGGQFLPDER